MKIALAINPTSGRGWGARLGQEAAATLRAGGLEVKELIARDEEQLRSLVRSALKKGVDALVVVGGDGMVHLGVTAVALSDVPLGIVAAGTGNDIARALGLPIRDAPAAARAVLAGLAPAPGPDGPEPSAGDGPVTAHPHRRRIDAVRVGTPGRVSPDTWYAGVLCAGFDAIVNERANGWRHPSGRVKYVLATLRELPVFRSRNYRVDLDGEPVVTGAVLVAVANGPSYGGGMFVCPDASMDDGLLDVLLVKPLSRTRFLRVFPQVFKGTHVTHPNVLIRRARTVRVQSAGIVGYADGERIAALPLTCECVPGAVEVLGARARGSVAE
jgi:diacylglycerol kinase (ATP)